MRGWCKGGVTNRGGNVGDRAAGWLTTSPKRCLVPWGAQAVHRLHAGACPLDQSAGRTSAAVPLPLVAGPARRPGGGVCTGPWRPGALLPGTTRCLLTSTTRLGCFLTSSSSCLRPPETVTTSSSAARAPAITSSSASAARPRAMAARVAGCSFSSSRSRLQTSSQQAARCSDGPGASDPSVWRRREPARSSSLFALGFTRAGTAGSSRRATQIGRPPSARLHIALPPNSASRQAGTQPAGAPCCSAARPHFCSPPLALAHSCPLLRLQQCPRSRPARGAIARGCALIAAPPAALAARRQSCLLSSSRRHNGQAALLVGRRGRRVRVPAPALPGHARGQRLRHFAQGGSGRARLLELLLELRRSTPAALLLPCKLRRWPNLGAVAEPSTLGPCCCRRTC